MTRRQSLVQRSPENFHTIGGSLVLDARHATTQGEIQMRSHTGSDGSAITARSMSRTNRWRLALAVFAMAFFNVSCSDEKPPEPPPIVAEVAVDEAPPPTHLRINTLTLQNTSLNGQMGAGYADLYSGTAYGGQDASDNADRIDFRYQYRGRDIANKRSFENMSTKSRWDRAGLFTNVTSTESKIARTAIDEATFDSIENDDDLMRSFDFQPVLEASASRHRREYLSNAADEPLSGVFAFIDKNGRRGLFKIVSAETAPIDTVSEGKLTIEIKIEDRQG